MELFVYIFLFLFGSAFGSLGSVLIWRLSGTLTWDKVKGVLYGRSECPGCKHNLGVLDLFPVFSWLFLGGKCRHCNKKIGIFYLMLELFGGILFMGSYYFVVHYLGYVDFLSGEFWSLLLYMIFVNYILMLLIFADLLFYELNVPLWVIGLLFIVFMNFLGYVGNFKIMFTGGILFFVVFYAIYRFGKLYMRYRFKVKGEEGFGLGDVMVAFLVGMMLQYMLIDINSVNMIYLSFIYIFVSSFFGMIFAIVSVFLRKGGQGQAIPFLPAMILAYYILLFYGQNLVDYISSF